MRRYFAEDFFKDYHLGKTDSLTLTFKDRKDQLMSSFFLLSDTDSPNPGMVHGYSLHEELRNLVVAGLSPYEAIKTATINAASFLKMENQIGAVKEGMIADLILLERNPLENIANTKLQLGVIVRGVWYSKNDLKSIIAAKFEKN